MAIATSFHLNAHLSAPRLGDRALDDFEITSGFADLHGFHVKSFRCNG
jgi:hypothetical protein